MSREVRYVPADWQHPVDPSYPTYRDGSARYIPLHKGPYREAVRDWDAGAEAWKLGLVSDWNSGWKPKPDYVRAEVYSSYADWAGERPKAEDYMPEWPEGTATHLMMYETCTEGTPISPAFPTPEQLARWLADNGASAFGSHTASYEDWLATCSAGWAPSAVFTAPTGLISGVEAANHD